MKILLWIVQIVLAFLALASGGYKVFAFQFVPTIPSTYAFSRNTWTAFGVFEILCAILLIVPAATNWMPTLTPLAAALLALESLLLAVVYVRYSRALAATNPLVYVVPMALLATFVAIGRHALTPH